MTTVEPNTPSTEIVNREDELRAIEETLYRLTTPDRLLPKQILEFNGIGGIGKSALLQKFLQACKTKTNLRYSFIDFAEFLREGQRIDLNRITLGIVQQIDVHNEFYEQIVGHENETSEFVDLPRYIERILQTPHQEIPLALIFDSIDEADQSVKDWLVNLVDRTIDAGKILFAIASKTSLGFSNRPSLEKRAYSFRLKELDQEATLRQIQKFGHFDQPENLQHWAKAVFRMTQGHPLANQVVVFEAQKRQYNPQHIHNQQDEFVRIIDQKVVREKVFQGYDAKEIDLYRQILTPLSIPRLFNLTSMGKLIKQFAPELALKSSWHYSNYIRELQAETFFVRYSREKSGYTVDPILRSVFSLTLKNEEERKYKEIHKFLVDLYTEWIADAKGTDKTKFFLEKIYHQFCLDKPADDLLKEFQSFAQIVGKNMSEDKRRDAKQQFIEEFSLDPDLGEFFEETKKSKINKMFA